MSKTKVTFKDRTDWLQARTQGIGASEVPTILGCNPFETPYQLWLRKKGLSQPKAENFAMKAGHYLEDAVSKFYSDATGAHIIKSSKDDFMYVSDEKPFLRVSPDRTYWRDGSTHNEANKCILECKTTQLEVDEEQPPQHWFCQLQMNLGVAELQHGALAWLTRGRTFGSHEYDFDKDFFMWMTEKVEKFWRDCIVGDQEPAVTTIEDITLKFPRSTEKATEVSEELLDKLNILKTIRPQLDELTRQKKDIEDMVKAYMADADTLCQQGTKEHNPVVLATWKTAKDSLKFNEKLFASEHPDIYAQYQRTVPGSRRLLIK